MRAEKEVGWDDIWEAWGGVPAIETMLPVLLSEGVNKHRLTLPALQRVCCENPAKIFGNYPRKGRIQEGADADLVMVDLKMRRKVRAEDLHQKVNWTPYEGMDLERLAHPDHAPRPNHLPGPRTCRDTGQP